MRRATRERGELALFTPLGALSIHVPQPPATWPIIEHEPEQEPTVPPDLSGQHAALLATTACAVACAACAL